MYYPISLSPETKKILTLLGIGILAGLITAHIYYQGLFIPWTRLADIPEKPQKIIAVNKGIWIKTESSNIYHYLSSDASSSVPIECTRDCWQKVEAAPANDSYIFVSSGCGRHIPLTWWLVDSVTACQGFGPAAIAFAYGFDTKGRIYYWSHLIGDMDGIVYLMFPVYGGICGVIISLIWLAVSDVYARLKKQKLPIRHDNLPDN